MKTPLCAYTNLAFLINYLTGHRCIDLSTDDVRTAARQGGLVCLLATRFGHLADFHYLVRKPAALDQLEAGLAEAAATLDWSERRRIGVSSNGLCLAMAIVLEAIQQHFGSGGADLHAPPAHIPGPMSRL